MSLDASGVVAIANPAAGRGRGGRLIPALRAAMAARGAGGVLVTTRAGEEATMAEAAARDGATTIIALGGDGTWSNVGHGILAAGTYTRLALAAAGTGNDLAFATRAPAHDLGAAVDAALHPAEMRLDVGLVDGVHFLNCAGFGFDAEVLRRTHEVRWLRGHAVYLLTAARLLFSFPAVPARIDLAGESGDAQDGETPLRPHLAVIVANGPRFGGGFLIAPGARVDDGMLDVVSIADARALRRVALFSRLIGGTHERAPEVT
ncbi:MAG: diacylglycerol kinase family protein, partial [Gemmatimonadaceae bacterium]